MVTLSVGWFLSILAIVFLLGLLSPLLLLISFVFRADI